MKMKNEFDDRMLESDGQQQVRQLVSGLPEDTLSMAWRSSLNEKLMQNAKQNRRRQLLTWTLRPALGLGLAGIFAFVVMFRASTVSEPAPVHKTNQLEAALVHDHEQNLLMSDVAGVGLNPIESRPTQSTESDAWSEVDFESL